MMNKDKLRPVEFYDMSFAEERAKMQKYKGWFHALVEDKNFGAYALIELENGCLTRTDNVTSIKFLDR